MFNSDFNERTRETISLGGGVLSFEILEILVVFMEARTLKPTEANIEQLFVAADYLQITSALRVLSDYLFSDLGSKKIDDIKRSVVYMLLRLIDILTRFIKATGYSLTMRTVVYYRNATRSAPFKCPNDALLYLAHHFKTIMYNHDLLKLDYDLFEKILKSDYLRLAEEEVVRMIKIWINHDYEERRKHFGALIRCVRFDENMTVRRRCRSSPDTED